MGDTAFDDDLEFDPEFAFDALFDAGSVGAVSDFDDDDFDVESFEDLHMEANDRGPQRSRSHGGNIKSVQSKSVGNGDSSDLKHTIKTRKTLQVSNLKVRSQHESIVSFSPEQFQRDVARAQARVVTRRMLEAELGIEFSNEIDVPVPGTILAVFACGDDDGGRAQDGRHLAQKKENLLQSDARLTDQIVPEVHRKARLGVTFSPDPFRHDQPLKQQQQPLPPRLQNQRQQQYAENRTSQFSQPQQVEHHGLFPVREHHQARTVLTADLFMHVLSSLDANAARAVSRTVFEPNQDFGFVVFFEENVCKAVQTGLPSNPSDAHRRGLPFFVEAASRFTPGRDPRTHDPESLHRTSTLVLKNLPFTLRRDQLLELLRVFVHEIDTPGSSASGMGAVGASTADVSAVEVDYVYSGDGKFRGLAFARFASADAAALVFSELCGLRIGGRAVHIEYKRLSAQTQTDADIEHLRQQLTALRDGAIPGQEIAFVCPNSYLRKNVHIMAERLGLVHFSVGTPSSGLSATAIPPSSFPSGSWSSAVSDQSSSAVVVRVKSVVSTPRSSSVASSPVSAGSGMQQAKHRRRSASKPSTPRRRLARDSRGINTGSTTKGGAHSLHDGRSTGSWSSVASMSTSSSLGAGHRYQQDLISDLWVRYVEG